MGESMPVTKAGSDSAEGAGGGKRPDLASAQAQAAAKFLADLRARGEAVEADQSADSERDERPPLPPGVTHEIVPGQHGAAPTVRRRRFSAF